MSAPIYSLLANELDISEAKAKKLVTAMLGEVRKRARREGVRLPDLGKFSEKNGRLTFEPSESLARAVNHRFEGLETEDLGPVPDEEEEDTQDQGPSTITLGYQNSDWSPIDSEDPTDTPPEEPEPDDEDEPDTEEFEVPSAEDAADTEELQAASTSDPPKSGEPDPPSSSETASAASPDPSDSDDPPTDTEELYPLVEDVPGSEAEASSASSDSEVEKDAERETLSGIWDSDDDGGEDDGVQEDTLEDYSEPASRTETEPSAPAAPQPESHTEEEPTVEEPTPPTPVEGSPETQAGRATATADDDRSSTPRILVTILVLLMLGGAAWYVLGQQGLVPTPGSTFTQVQSQLGPHVNNLPLVGTSQGESDVSPPEASEDTAPSQGAQSADADAASQESNSEDGTASQSSMDASSEQVSASASSATQSSAPSEIDPSAGGWTIIVASRADRSGASSLADAFRERFDAQQLPIGVIPGTVDNSTRYRVGIGQFDSQSEAERFVDEFGSELPDGAWILRLQ